MKLLAVVITMVTLLSAGGLAVPAWMPVADDETWVIKAGSVHTGDGTVYQPGAVVISGGKIVAAAKAPDVPDGARVIDVSDGAVTPGLIDAACQRGTHQSTGFAEQSSEVIPHLSVADAVDYFSSDFEELAAGGVTTVYVTPEASSVVGSHGIVVKTAGPWQDRQVEAPPSIKVNIGLESWRRGSRNRPPFGEVTFLARRPTTRMGSVFVLRHAFYEAIEHHQNAGTESAVSNAAMDALASVLSGDTRLRFQARLDHDIETAARLADEFGLTYTLEYATECYRHLDLLAAKKTPVIFGPIYEFPRGLTARSGEGGEPCLTTLVKLRDRKIPFALTAADLSGEGSLARQAGWAVRYGLTREEALASVTSSPASLLGISDRVGALAAGKEADLVVWSGLPLESGSAVRLVLVNGQVIFDPGHLADEDKADS